MSIKRALGRIGIVLAVAAPVVLTGCTFDISFLFAGDDDVATSPALYTLTTNANPIDGGYVLRSPNQSYYDAGTKVVLAAKANAGYGFIGWGGSVSSKNESITVIMNSNLTLTATFQLQGADGKDTTGGGSGNGAGNSVKIGDLTWTKNLNIETPESWCYDDDPANCAIYGRLYTWEAARSVCASMGGGRRLPTNEDKNKLINYAGGPNAAGKTLKAKSGWNNSGSGTDDYGFSAMPGGGLYESDSRFGGVGSLSAWWSATADGSERAYVWGMVSGNSSMQEGTGYRGSGFSVRCVTKN